MTSCSTGEVEAKLRAALAAGHAAWYAMYTLYVHEGVPAITLTRAVSTVFNLPLAEARQIVADLVAGKGPNRHADWRLPNPAEWWVGWGEDLWTVMDALTASSPVFLGQQASLYQASYFPSFHDPLRLIIELEPRPVLRAITAELFSPTREPDRVVVARWPVPIKVSELHHWSTYAWLSAEQVQSLHNAALPFVGKKEVHNSAGALDGLSVAGIIGTAGQSVRLAGWALDSDNTPELHAFFSQLIRLALDVLPGGHVKAASQDVAQYLFPAHTS